MKTPIKAKKAFILSSLMGSVLMSTNNGEPKLSALKVQIDKAMKVFSIKAGKKEYWYLAGMVKEMWDEIAKEHNNTLDTDEVALFIEMIFNLMPSKDMKDFLNMKYTTKEKIRDERKSAIMATVLDLDSKLNNLLGTTQTATRETLGEVMVKPVKAKKVKADRDKAKSQVLKKIRNRAKWNRQRVAV